MPWCGWLAALLAALTAYIRTLGGTVLGSQDFRGSMAKPHRMWLMVAACVLAPLETRVTGTAYALPTALVVTAAGSALTCWTRLHSIANRLQAAASSNGPRRRRWSDRKSTRMNSNHSCSHS